jgi:flagellar hook-length control protein FliK
VIPDGASAAPQDTVAALPFAALPFADLLGQLADAVSVDAQDGAPAAQAGAEPAAADEADSQAGDQPLLTAAMSMALRLMPAALAAANVLGAAGATAAVGAVDGAPGRTGRTAAAGTGLAQDDANPDDTVAPQAVAAQAPRAATPAPVSTEVAQAPAAAGGAAAGLPAAADGDSAAGSGAAAPRDSAAVSGAALAPHAPAPARDGGADTVALAGPPTAWRQSLREALGERLHLQAGHGLEQAVIRLDPPQLGRVEIAIRHSAGSLEVTLSATHGEVLRQLQGVSESLRNDLAQRQFTEVAVTVAPAPRNAAANPFGGEAGNRGRQGGREQEQQAPGMALFDDGPGTSGFSLT